VGSHRPSNLIRIMPAQGAGGRSVSDNQAELTATDLTPAGCDVAVIGAGLIGLAIGWRLAGRGLAVTVVDPAPASAASHAAAGMLAPVSEVTYGEEALLRLSIESLRRYPGFVEELESLTVRDVGLRRAGTLIAATDAGDRGMLTQLHAFQQRLGLSATMLSSRECRGLEPALSPIVRCGLLVDGDHSVDNRRLAAALLDAATGAGAQVLRSRVRHVSVLAGRVTGVVTDAGALSAATVVLAAGPWSARIDGVPDADRPPVRPVKGEILRLRARDTVPVPSRTIRGYVNGQSVYVLARTSGEVIIGATVLDRGFDTTVRAGAVHDLLRDARALVPSVDELDLVETLAALRPGSPDNAPMIGRTGTDGLIVATGHHRNGVLLTPLTAELVADLVTGGDGADPEIAAAVSPARFAAVPA
jgi:glycine oxidase